VVDLGLEQERETEARGHWLPGNLRSAHLERGSAVVRVVAVAVPLEPSSVVHLRRAV